MLRYFRAYGQLWVRTQKVSSLFCRWLSCSIGFQNIAHAHPSLLLQSTTCKELSGLALTLAGKWNGCSGFTETLRGSPNPTELEKPEQVSSNLVSNDKVQSTESLVAILLLEYKIGISIVLFSFTVKTAFTCKRNMASHTSTLFGFQNMGIILKCHWEQWPLFAIRIFFWKKDNFPTMTVLNCS